MTAAKKNHILSTIAAWIGLMVFTLVLSRPNTLFPLSFIAIISIFLGSALYKEQPAMRSLAYFAVAMAVIFSLFTFFSNYYIKTSINLFDIAPHPVFSITLLVLLALSNACFISLAFCLVKFITKTSSAFTMIAFNVVVYVMGFVALRLLIQALFIR